MSDYQLFIISLNLLGIICAIWGGAIVIATAIKNRKETIINIKEANNE